MTSCVANRAMVFAGVAHLFLTEADACDECGMDVASAAEAEKLHERAIELRLQSESIYADACGLARVYDDQERRDFWRAAMKWFHG